MKLRTKIIMLAIIPFICFAAFISIFSSKRFSEGIFDETYKGMEAAAIAIRDGMKLGINGDYHMDDKGNMWIGHMVNISGENGIVDSIKKNTGLEVTIFYEDTRKLTSIVNEYGDRQIGSKASEEVVQKVLKNGENYFSDEVLIFNKRHISCYIPIYQNGTTKPVGMVFIGKPYDEVESIIQDMRKDLFFIAIVISVIVLIISIVLIIQIMKAVAASSNILNEISSGNLNVNIKNKYLTRRDELGDILRSIAHMKENLSKVISHINNQSTNLIEQSKKLEIGSDEASISMKQIDESIQDLASQTEIQAGEAQTAEANMKEMGDLLKETSIEVTNLNVAADQISNTSKHAKQTLEELEKTMSQVNNAILLVYEQTNSTNESVKYISKAAAFITDIAEQTNLLSLNATIEAARAGEHGKGFCVVASEIKSLAGQSNESAKEIQKVLQQLSNNSNQAVETMESIKNIVGLQKQKIVETDKAFVEVQEGISDSISGIGRLDQKYIVLQEARVKTTDCANHVSQIAQENATGIEETAASIVQVNLMVDEVKDSVNQLSQITKVLGDSIKLFSVE